MTETAEEKTRREFLSTYKQYVWHYQTTIFLQDYAQRLSAIQIFSAIRRRLPRLHPESPILWRVILSKIPDYGVHLLKNYDSKEAATLPALTLFTFDRPPHAELGDNIELHLTKHFGGLVVPIEVRQRYIASWKNRQYIKAVRSEEPHDLKNYFNLTTSPQRYGIISAKHAVGIGDRLKEDG